MAIEDPVVIAPNGKFIPCYFDSGISLTETKSVESVNDLPAAVGGVITLEAGKAYFISGAVDLLGARLACAGRVCLYGTSSETSSIKSTGLAAGTALITSGYALPLKNLTIDHAIGLALNATGNGNQALDWYGTNFTGAVGTIAAYDNLIAVQCAFFAGGLTYDLAVNTLGFDNCLFVVPASAVGINIPSTGIINRRMRVQNSSFVVASGGEGIYVDSGAYNQLEALIGENLNFSGSGTYISGKTPYWHNWYLKGCRGVTDTFVLGQVHMQGNATATVVSASSTWYKAAGTTTASSQNSRVYNAGDNNLTNDAFLNRKMYMVASGTVTIASGSNVEVEVGFYDSTIPGIRTPSRQVVQVASSTTEVPFSISCFTEWNSQGQYIEFHVANNTNTTDIVVKNLNLTISEV